MGGGEGIRDFSPGNKGSRLPGRPVETNASVLPPAPLVFGHNMKSSNDFIGRVVIGQYSSGPSESNHWRRMLSAHRTAVEQWHSLRSRAECDRVSPASLEVT